MLSRLQRTHSNREPYLSPETSIERFLKKFFYVTLEGSFNLRRRLRSKTEGFRVTCVPSVT